MATQKIKAANGDETPVVFAKVASAWVTATAYVVGIVVTDSGNSYFCLVSHTSGTLATDIAASPPKWVLVTAVVWTPSTTPLAITKTRISAVWDRGAGHQPVEYQWFASVRWAATVTAADSLRLYLIGALSSASPLGTVQNLTFGDADLSATSDILGAGGVYQFGRIIAASATDQVWVNGGTLSIIDRYIAIAAYNAAVAKALTSATGSDHWIYLAPVPPVIEAAV